MKRIRFWEGTPPLLGRKPSLVGDAPSQPKVRPDILCVVRFIGDPVGYLVLLPDSDAELGWLSARVGNTTRKVWVNLAQAYIIDPQESRGNRGGYATGGRGLRDK